MKKIIMRWFGLLFLLICVCAALASPRQPIPPAPERPAIYQETFNEFAAPLSTNDFLSVAGFALTADWSGYGLSCTGPTVTPWAIPALSAGRTNVESDAPGAFRVWFNPDYSSSSIVGGTGPGETAKLADFVATSSGGTAEIWTLEVSSNGNVLEAIGYGSSGPVTLLSTPIAWQAGSPHLIAFNYSSSATALFVDGQLVAQGAGTVAIPPSVGALVLGSSFDGTEPADGVLDEVFCFAGPLTGQETVSYYNYTAAEAALGPISAEEDARRAWVRAHRLSGGLSTMSPMGLGRVYDPDHAMTCSPGGGVYLTNVTATLQTNGQTLISFSVEGGTNGVLYDLYSTSNITNTVANHTMSWAGQVLTCNTYSFSNQPPDLSFYLLGVPVQTMTVAWGSNYNNQCNVPYGLSNAMSIAGGGYFSLALRSDSTVVGWGGAGKGETNFPSGLTNVGAIAAGQYHGLALLTNGAVTNWGTYTDGSSYYSVTNSYPGIPGPPTSNVMAIAAGLGHDLALLSNGTVTSWGLTNLYATDPASLGIQSNLTGVKAIASGWDFHVALMSNGTVTAWGENDPALGYTMTNVPANLSNVVAIASGAMHTLALLTNGTVISWGYSPDGETNVPAGLSNVVAVAAGGFQSMALQANGNVVIWGDTNLTNIPAGLVGVKAIAGGYNHNLAIQSGMLTPVIFTQPTDQYATNGGSATFSASGEGVAGVTYQWQFNGTNVTGATNGTMTLTNTSATNVGNYDVVVSTETGSITSSVVTFSQVLKPAIFSAYPPASNTLWIAHLTTLSVGAYAAGLASYPLHYEWQFNGTNLTGGTYATSYDIAATNDGTYTVVITNVVGSTNVSWIVRMALPGMVDSWGSDSSGECDRPATLTNASGIAAGEYQSLAVTDSGTVLQWGEYSDGLNFYSVTNSAAVTAPPASNVVAVAAGLGQALALKSDSTVVAWGLTNAFGTTVPTNLNLTNVIAVGCGWQFDVVLLSNGTVKAWGDDDAALGYTMTNVPPNLSNVTAIAAGPLHTLALKSDGTVVAWGYNPDGETNVPPGLSNVVAIAAGESHNLALKSDGTVVAWGLNNFGQTNVPAGLSNVIAIAAGDAHSVALKNDWTLVEWGDNGSSQASVPVEGPTNYSTGSGDTVNTTTYPPIVVKLIAAGGDHTMAAIWSPLVQYPINVSKDLLLIYNTNSLDSSNVCQYYLTHRPMVNNANVLGIGCETNEQVANGEYTTNIALPIQNWLAANPTKRPSYVVLFEDIPSRPDATYLAASTQFQINSTCATNWHPFVSSINMNGTGGTNDCIAYINKLASIGSNYCPGQLIIGASIGGYGNTNWYFDDTQPQGYSAFIYPAVAAVTNVYPNASVTYTNVTSAPAIGTLAGHITSASNVAGFASWGTHGYYGNTNAGYATNETIQFSGRSGWYLMQTIESFNGMRTQAEMPVAQGNFIQWFSSSAFDGTNYSNTPVGAVSNVEEPNLTGNNNPALYFGYWADGKIFTCCAWNSFPYITAYLQVVGDPFVKH